MKIKIQVVIEHEDETLETIEEEISCLQRGSPSLETLGLTLTESKEILANLQEQIVKQQVAEHIRKFEVCHHCRQPRRRNGRQKSPIEPCLATSGSAANASIIVHANHKQRNHSARSPV